ncbi:MAG TPA: DNA polymerase ligase N-terminal domain-containing protein [Candidatus Glassbacteria bacterium]|nr:DNA polymerase ligase N-terminal domain-containing protein [Candidatus Glassbacteria bacterium]
MSNSEFVVTEHHAKRAGLHWDLRFEMPKSKLWASFAVRKGVPLSPGKKVLAVKTHDHKRDEALLTGKIESGYGAGTLKEWDRGQCVIHKYSPAHVAIEFKGKKIKGMYHLINIGIKDKNFEGQQYWLFKGKALNEWSLPENYPDRGSAGMFGRVPPDETSEVEMPDEDSDKQQIEKLPWSISEAEKVMKDYAIIAQYQAMKGFFTKKIVGEYLILGIKDNKNDTFVLLQFHDRFKDNMYLVSIVGNGSPDDDVLEGEIDKLRYHSQIKILEDKIPIAVSFGNKITLKFKKVSKYLGSSLELNQDSRLPEGYMIAKVKMKQGFEPAQQYKIGSGAMDFDLNLAKKMRAFTSSRLKAIMKQEK